MLPLTVGRYSVDFNDLYSRHQVALFMSEHAACEHSRAVHRDLAEGYAARIAGELSDRRMVAA